MAINEKAVSDAQANAARAALAGKKGKITLKPGSPSYNMAKGMTKDQLKDFTKTEAKASGGLSDPANLEKLVKVLAKKVEDFQNYVGVDQPYDAGIDVTDREIENLKNPKISKFWNSLSSKQQNELHGMITTHLRNKALKQDPDYFDSEERPEKIVYKLSTKTAAPEKGAAGGMDKLAKYLAKKAEDHMNYVGLDSPEQIMFNELEDVIEMDIKDAKIKKIWNSMKAKQQEDLYEKVVAILEKKYGGGDGYDDDMYESTKLGEIAKKLKEDYRSYTSDELYELMSKYEGLWDDFEQTDQESSDENLYNFLKSRGLIRW